MNKGSVPTAIAAIVVMAICFVGFMTIRDRIEKHREEVKASEAARIGELPNIRVTINGKTYYAKPELNKTAKSFISNLPLSISMKDNSNNRKEGYTYVKIDTGSFFPKKIKSGDIMLSGESVVVVFYKDVNTNEKYSKIGHIDNFEYIEGETMTVGFSKVE